jgi:hypothetical protein
MESVSSTVHFAVLSASVAAVTRGRCRPARAVTIPITLPLLAGHSTSTCASPNGRPKKIHTSSALVHATITSTHSQWNGRRRKPRPHCAKFMARPHPTSLNTSPLSGPIVTIPNQNSVASSLNGSMKNIPHRRRRPQANQKSKTDRHEANELGNDSFSLFDGERVRVRGSLHWPSQNFNEPQAN